LRNFWRLAIALLAFPLLANEVTQCRDYDFPHELEAKYRQLALAEQHPKLIKPDANPKEGEPFELYFVIPSPDNDADMAAELRSPRPGFHPRNPWTGLLHIDGDGVNQSKVCWGLLRKNNTHYQAWAIRISGLSRQKDPYIFRVNVEGSQQVATTEVRVDAAWPPDARRPILFAASILALAVLIVLPFLGVKRKNSALAFATGKPRRVTPEPAKTLQESMTQLHDRAGDMVETALNRARAQLVLAAGCGLAGLVLILSVVANGGVYPPASDATKSITLAPLVLIAPVILAFVVLQLASAFFFRQYRASLDDARHFETMRCTRESQCAAVLAVADVEDKTAKAQLLVTVLSAAEKKKDEAKSEATKPATP